MIMDDLTLINNEFLRQFEVKIEDSLARIEYSEQERKIFLTKLHIPKKSFPNGKLNKKTANVAKNKATIKVSQSIPLFDS